MKDWKFAVSAATLVLCLLQSGGASAQQALTPAASDPAAPDQTAEIVVTAQLRRESGQKVPVSVMAIGGDTLAKANVSSLQNLSGSGPSVVVSKGVSYGLAPITIRGLGSPAGGGSLFTDQSVAVYVDGSMRGLSSAPLPASAGWQWHRARRTGLGAILAPALPTPLFATHGWRIGYYMLAVIALGECSCRAAAARGGLGLDSVGASAARRGRRRQGFSHHRTADPARVGGRSGQRGAFPLLTDGGMALAKADGIAPIIGLAAIVSRLMVGVMLDRIAPAAVAVGLFMIAASGGVLLWLTGTTYAVAAAIVLGLSVGAEGNLIAVLSARHFAPARYRQAYGALYALFLFGGAIGPAMIGFLFDKSSGDQVPMFVAAGMLVIAALVATRLILLAPASTLITEI